MIKLKELDSLDPSKPDEHPLRLFTKKQVGQFPSRNGWIRKIENLFNEYHNFFRTSQAQRDPRGTYN